MNNSAYKTLYKSVGMPEWRLIVGEKCRRFHPRLLTRPLFYPALSFTYACKLAKEWNTIDHLSEYTGIVIGFNVPPDFLSTYEDKINSDCNPRELWVTVDELYQLNSIIDGRLKVYETFYGEQYNKTRYTPQDLNEESFLP